MEDKSEGQRNDFMRALEALDKGLDLEALRKQAGEIDVQNKPLVESKANLYVNEV